MNKKIKLTDKDLELHITSSDYSVNYTQMPDTREPKCPTTTLAANCRDTFGIDCQDTFNDDCPLTADIDCYETKCLDCFENTMGATCPTATFRTVCLSQNPSCDCGGGGDTQGCQDTGGCADPLTYNTQCGGCNTNNNCGQTNTCTCNESRYCDTTNCLDTGNNCESRYHVCETYDNNCYDTGADCLAPESDNCGVISNDCGETFPCAISEIGCNRISELANCETTAIKCTQ